jgi:hypothetical protein
MFAGGEIYEGNLAAGTRSAVVEQISDDWLQRHFAISDRSCSTDAADPFIRRRPPRARVAARCSAAGEPHDRDEQ